MRFVLRRVDFMTKDDFRRALSAHHCDFSGRPRYYPVGPKVFTAHGDISASVGLAQHHRNFGDCGCRIGEKHFCAMPNNSPILLLNPWQKTRSIHESEQRKVEGVAEAHETSHFV